ncbi:L,D-transpeptidase family protein [Clostridium psychrophilum]|uniref:L,D-transpeptidase family protein n=1 Tax=Clostridium psychrophilum TaxID=132926 RepID=UPI001C0E855C|nr:peptidoglycan-binding protein [Clostridium psychrophilum]MBU3182908.1 L,D-transpeptidase family protein [Clostridium psychrophilum]
MIKRYLSCVFLLSIIILGGGALANKDGKSVNVTTTDIKLYQNNISVSQNNILKKQFLAAKTTFKQGDKGIKVREIQQKLNKFGYKLYADGNFGKLTRYAVMDFQTKNKILKNGIVGSLTMKKLDMKPTSSTMYKTPVIKKNTSKVSVSNNSSEKYINSKKITSLTGYFIWIDSSHQKVNVFHGSNKKWRLVKSMVCSSGKTSTPTIKGHFTVGRKGSYFISSGGARCKYYTQIRGNYLFHSVLYDRKGNYVIDNTLGARVSHGCVRLALSNAKYIYYNIPTRTSIWSN